MAFGVCPQVGMVWRASFRDSRVEIDVGFASWQMEVSRATVADECNKTRMPAYVKAFVLFGPTQQ